jgi:Zn-dependent peptidase ImmA (M78 family)/DNA-binding XRE family transcriptional regulator
VDLGPQIRKRRESFGLSTAQVAGLANLTPARVGAIEAGELLTTWELAAVAGALATDPARLRAGTADDDIYRSAVRFRSAQGAESLSPMDVRLLARAAEAGRLVAWLRTLFQEPASRLVDMRQVQGVDGRKRPWQQGYELGEAARMRLAPGGQRLESIQQLLEEAGVHIALVDFESSHIEAASLFESDAAPVILLNAKNDRIHYPLARRAILAHELCHLLHDGGQRNLLTQVSQESDSSPTEQRANGFAPSFLAPRKWVLRSPSGDHLGAVVRLAEDWGLSFEGAAWHAKNLKLIPPEVAEDFQRTLDKPRINTSVEPDLARTSPELYDIDFEPSPLTRGLLAELALRAAARGLITRPRAAEILVFQ